MPYTITHSDGERSITVQDKTINTDTSLKLLGKDYPQGYAKIVAEDFLHLLENFSSPTPPANPVEGQLWYDTDVTSNIRIPQLKVFDGTEFVSATNVFKGVSKPVGARIGDIWIDIAKQQLFIYSGMSGGQFGTSGYNGNNAEEASWLLIGPQFSAGSSTGPVADKVYDVSNRPHNIIKFIVGIIEDESVTPPIVRSETAAILSFTTFTPKASIQGFSVIKSGLNVSSMYNSKMWGTAEKADSLVVGNDVVQSANFLRRDVSSTTNFKFNVATAEGIAIGDALTSGIKTTGSGVTVVYNNISNSSVVTRLSVDGTDVDMISVSKDLARIATNAEVIGDLNVATSLEVQGTREATVTSPGALQVSGGATVGKSLVVAADATVGGTLKIGITSAPGSETALGIDPLTNEKYSIGSAERRFKQIFSKEVRASTIVCDELQGTFTGNVLGAAASLISPTSYKLVGEIESEVVQTNHAAGSSVQLQTVATQSLFNNRGDPISESSMLDQLLINKPQVGIRRITKEKFLSNVPVIPVGGIIPFAGTSLPRGFVFCDGAAYLMADYQLLYEVIGWTHSDTASGLYFNVPNIPDIDALGKTVRYIIFTGVM